MNTGASDKSSIQVDPELDDNGLPIITKQYLKNLCDAHDLYTTPSLNERLFVHHKGFQTIQNLDDYINLKVLYLDHNSIKQIENLHMLKNLRGLYLQNNIIEKIEGLDELTNLRALNLSHNRLTKIENLEKLTNLENLDVSNNYLENSEAIRGLTECPSLTNINLSNNATKYSDDILPIFTALVNLKVLYLKDNALKRDFVNYRKVMVGTLTSLTFLDERPVGDEEQRLAIAFKEGGSAGENQEREKMEEERRERERQDKLENKERDDRARLRKKLELERIDREARAEKEELLKKKLEITGKRPEGWQSKLKTIEAHLDRVNRALGIDPNSIEAGQAGGQAGGNEEETCPNELDELE